jgi:lipopolysaccharide transport system permease protein
MKAGSEPLVVVVDPCGEEAAGWQLIDLDSGNLIAEGPWAGACGEQRIPAPAEAGNYRVLVSPVSQARGWAYERGAAVRVIDLTVTPEGWAVAADRITTLSRLRLTNLPARMWRLLREPWELLWSQRALIASMVRRDIATRYRGTFADAAWTVLQPLLLMLTYWFVFGFVLKARLGGDDRPSIFVLYFLCGMLPWLAISEALGRAPNVILESRNLVKKLVFPVTILPVNLVAAGLVFLHRAVLQSFPVDVIWIPIYFLPQLLLTLGLCWAWAAIGAFARDLGQINGFLLTLWFFLTPICYPEDSLPPAAVAILRKNPLYKLVGGYRLLFIADEGPNWTVAMQLLLMGLVTFYAGYALFRKLRRSFADSL